MVKSFILTIRGLELMYLPNKRPDDMARITTIELANKFIDEQVALVREQVKLFCLLLVHEPKQLVHQ